MRIQFSADDVKLEVIRDGGKFSPSIVTAENGRALIEFTQAELCGLLIAFANAALEEHGTKIESADLDLSSSGACAVQGSLRLNAKKMRVKLTLTINARAEVDERLTVRFSELSAAGEGLIASMAAGVLNTKLREYEGSTFDLAPAALQNVEIAGLKVDASDPVRISASFQA